MTNGGAGSSVRRPSSPRGPRLWKARPRWLRSRRSKEADLEREAYLTRLRELVGDDRYEDLIHGRVIMNPYFLDDLDRLEELQRKQDLDDPGAISPRNGEHDGEGSA